MRNNKFVKLGHQAPKGFRDKNFNYIEIKGDYAYCKSHNFVYNTEEEERKLYDGLPCYYTDIRFNDSKTNFYKTAALHWTRWKTISLKACIRKVLKCKNIPLGTIVDFKKSWYVPGKRIDLSYKFKIRKENKLDIDFEINDPRYYTNFTTCEFSKELTNELRNKGFIVRVDSNNTNFISSMISTATSLSGKEYETTSEEGEIAIAYGHGLKIGFSSGNNTLYGYSNAKENILCSKFGEFDKWSYCSEIPKNGSVQEIIKMLLAETTKEIIHG